MKYEMNIYRRWWYLMSDKIKVILDKHRDYALVIDGRVVGTLEWNAPVGVKLKSIVAAAIEGVEVPDGL